MADKQENQMTEIEAALIRCLDSAGNSGVIKPNNLSNFRVYGIVRESLDNYNNGVGYCANGEFDGSGIAGVFASFNINNAGFQIKANIANPPVLKFRCCNFNREWSDWKTISFT